MQHLWFVLGIGFLQGTLCAPKQFYPLHKEAPKAVCAADGYFPVSPCSSQFVDCQNGVATVGNCPGGTVFEETAYGQGICVYPSNNGCVADTSTTIPNTPFTTLTPDAICKEANGEFAAGQCSRYYFLCVDSKAYLQYCPGIFVFNPDTLRCEDPSAVNCTASRNI